MTTLRSSRGLLAAILALAVSGAGPAISASPSADVAACIRSTECTDMFIVAHRARGFGGPDNSLEAIRNAIAARQPIIEIDLRRTRDGELVVFHNRRLEFGTSGHGDLAEHTFEELRSVRLPNGESIPRFSDVYELARGRAVLDLHIKVKIVQPVAEWIASHGSFDDVIFFVPSPRMLKSAAQVKARYPSMMLMTRAHTRADLWTTRALLAQLPDLVHIDADKAGDGPWLQTQGVKVAIKALDLGHLSPDQRRHARRQALRSGAQLILVDDPRFFSAPPEK